MRTTANNNGTAIATTTDRATRGMARTVLAALGLLTLLVGSAHAIDTTLIKNSRWSGWHGRNGTTDQPITAITGFQNYQPRLFLFAKGVNDRGIYFADALPNAGQINWQRIGYGTTMQAIAAVGTLDYDTYAFARGDDTRVYMARRDRSSGAWTGFLEVPGGMTSHSALAATESGGFLYLFARRTDSQIAYTTMELRTNTWSAWRTLSMTSDIAPSVTAANGRVFLFTKGASDRRVYMSTFNTSTKTWGSSREVADGRLTSKPISATRGAKVRIAMVADDGSVFTREIDPLTGQLFPMTQVNGPVQSVSATYLGADLLLLSRSSSSSISENILQPPLNIEREVSVPAASSWVDTGLNLNQGESFAATAIGSWKPSSAFSCSGFGVPGLTSTSAIVPSAYIGTLVARIGGGTAFPLNASFIGSANATGRLYVRMNDIEGTYGDNTGALTLSVATNSSITVKVNARDGWTNTRVLMKAGSQFYGEATGLWATLCTSIRVGTSCIGNLSADGSVGVKNPSAVLPSANFGSLVGWVNGPVALGKSFAGSFPVEAPLSMSINDLPSSFADNTGSQSVTIYPGAIIN